MYTYVVNIVAIPVQGWTGPLGCSRLRLLNSLNNWRMKMAGFVTHKHQPPVPHWRYRQYPSYLEAGSTPGPYYGRKEIENATFPLVALCLNGLRHRLPL